jgi:hypothetical protein
MGVTVQYVTSNKAFGKFYDPSKICRKSAAIVLCAECLIIPAPRARANCGEKKLKMSTMSPTFQSFATTTEFCRKPFTRGKSYENSAEVGYYPSQIHNDYAQEERVPGHCRQ